jgi:DNA-directed RNA polymerase specialized sigma24 family protein
MPPKREMSHTEYADQQFYYRHDLKDPADLQDLFDTRLDGDQELAEENKEKRSALIEKLLGIVRLKIEKSLTKRQRDAINLFLLSKKQEYAAEILGISQEAVNSRLKIALKRLRVICNKDKSIQQILKEIKSIA